MTSYGPSYGTYTNQNRSFLDDQLIVIGIVIGKEYSLWGVFLEGKGQRFGLVEGIND